MKFTSVFMLSELSPFSGIIIPICGKSSSEDIMVVEHQAALTSSDHKGRRVVIERQGKAREKDDVKSRNSTRNKITRDSKLYFNSAVLTGVNSFQHKVGPALPCSRIAIVKPGLLAEFGPVPSPPTEC